MGAGSFGTAVAVLLVRAGLRTALLCRTAEQASELARSRHNERYLPGVELPRDLRVRALADGGDQLGRSDLVFLAVPSKMLPDALAELMGLGVPARAGIVSLAKGLVPPDGLSPTVTLEAVFGSQRVACVGGPSHAREMVESGAGLVCASRSEGLAHGVAEAFQRSGVVCEVSDDPVGVELAGVAKNAAAVAVGATQAQGLNAAGMAAADIFLEVLALARASGGHARTFVGRAGTGDLVATALAPTSRNRSAGELLAEGVPADEIAGRDRPGGRGARDRAPARPRDRAPAARGACRVRAGAPDRGLDAARRVDRARARQAAAARPLLAPVHVVGAAEGMAATPLESEGR